MILELPIGIEEANFSTAWAQNLVVRGGSRSGRSELIAAMAVAAQESGVPTWVAASAPDSAFSTNWRHHREAMSTGVVQARELLRLVCDQVFPRLDACRGPGTKDVRDSRIPVGLARPIAVFIDDLDALAKVTAGQVQTAESAEAVKVLIDFLAKTANLTNVSLIAGTSNDDEYSTAEVESLWSSAARLQLPPSIADAKSEQAPLYFAAPGLPAIPLETRGFRGRH